MDGQILIVEDDCEVADSIALFLRNEGLVVTHMDNGPQGLALALQGGWDAIILDVRLPGLDGFEICKQVRRQNAGVPILFLTACDEEVDMILGLEFGADDYIVKPFSGRTLVARIKARLRRARETGNGESGQVVRLTDREVDLAACVVRKGDSVVPLTAKECEVLRYLVARPKQPQTREEIFQAVWAERYYEGHDNTVAVHIRRIREKIEADPAKPRHLVTVGRSLGYRFDP